MKTLLTVKQREILRVITEGDVSTENGQRIPVDMDRLLELIPYKTSKQSMQFSLRALIKNGLILKLTYEKRRGRQRAIIEATDIARQIMGAKEDEPKARVSPVSLGELPTRIEEEVNVPGGVSSSEDFLSSEELDDFLKSL